MVSDNGDNSWTKAASPFSLPCRSPSPGDDASDSPPIGNPGPTGETSNSFLGQQLDIQDLGGISQFSNNELDLDAPREQHEAAAWLTLFENALNLTLQLMLESTTKLTDEARQAMVNRTTTAFNKNLSRIQTGSTLDLDFLQLNAINFGNHPAMGSEPDSSPFVALVPTQSTVQDVNNIPPTNIIYPFPNDSSLITSSKLRLVNDSGYITTSPSSSKSSSLNHDHGFSKAGPSAVPQEPTLNMLGPGLGLGKMLCPWPEPASIHQSLNVSTDIDDSEGAFVDEAIVEI